MKVFVGIDVSKEHLDVHVLLPSGRSQAFRTENAPAARRRILDRVRRVAGENSIHWCMEETAAYHWGMALLLLEAGELVSVENPRPIKHYGLALKSINKTDRADARLIALFAQAFAPKMWPLADPVRRELAFLDRRLDDLNKLKNQESNRLEHPGLPSMVVNGIRSSLAEFDRQIEEVLARLHELVQSDPALSRDAELLLTIPGIGERCTFGFLAQAGDAQNYQEAQDVAAYAGLNPKIRRSGSSVRSRSRVSKAGNAHLRKRLYMGAASAIQCNPVLKEFHQRLKARGLTKKAALVASERKLAMIMWGVLKHQTPFDPKWGLTK